MGGVLMRKRLVGLIASTMIVFAACQGAASPSPSSQAASVAPPPSAGASESAAAPSPSSDVPDLTHTSYKPDDGVDGGSIIIGDWQEANQFNPFYVGQVTEANVASAVWSSLAVFTNDYKYAPDLAEDIPTTDNGGVK